MCPVTPRVRRHSATAIRGHYIAQLYTGSELSMVRVRDRGALYKCLYRCSESGCIANERAAPGPFMGEKKEEAVMEKNPTLRKFSVRLQCITIKVDEAGAELRRSRRESFCSRGVKCGANNLGTRKNRVAARFMGFILACFFRRKEAR